jgi:hypothetical protein
MKNLLLISLFLSAMSLFSIGHTMAGKAALLEQLGGNKDLKRFSNRQLKNHIKKSKRNTKNFSGKSKQKKNVVLQQDPVTASMIADLKRTEKEKGQGTIYTDIFSFDKKVSHLDIATRLGKALQGSAVRKAFLSSNYCSVFSEPHTKLYAEAVAKAPQLEEACFYNVSWFSQYTPGVRTRVYAPHYLPLGDFMTVLAGNATLKVVKMYGFPNQDHADNFCRTFKGDLPFDIIFSTGVAHVGSPEDQKEVTTIAEMLRKRFGPKVMFDVPPDTGYGAEAPTWTLSKALGNIHRQSGR